MKQIASFCTLVLFSGVVLIYLWWGRFHYYHTYLLAFTYLTCGLIVLIGHLLFRDSRKSLGLRLDNWCEAAKWYGALTLTCGLLTLGCGFILGEFGTLDAESLIVYFLWAGIQQYFLQNVFRLRAESLLGLQTEGKGISATGVLSALIAAAFFGLFHLPNMLLAILTALGGFVWCLVFSRVPNLFGAWLSQAVLGSLLIFFFKQGMLDNFQVGAPGYRYEYYGKGVVVGAGYDGESRPLVVTAPGPDRDQGSQIRVFTPEGALLHHWEAFPELNYSARFAVGDLGYTAGDEIAVAPGPGAPNPATIRIFGVDGELLSEFTVEEFTRGYGAWVTIACGKLYVSPGPGPLAKQMIVELDSSGTILRKWDVSGNGLHNGLKSAVLCRSCEATDDCSREAVKLMAWGTEIAVNPSKVLALDLITNQLTTFETLPTTYGLNASIVQVAPDKNGLAVCPGPLKGYPAWVKVFSLDQTPEVIHDIAPYDDPSACGANLAAVDIDRDGTDELVMGEGVGKDRPSTVRIVRLDGTIVRSWNAYP
jgi:hypothetical protein